MNSNYYNQLYPGSIGGMTPNQQTAPTVMNTMTEEQSYIENIIRLNKGKIGRCGGV